MQLRINRSKLAWLLRVTAWGLLFLTGVAVVIDQWLLPLPTDKLRRPASQFVYDYDNHLLSAYTATDHFWRRPAELDSISPRLIEAVKSIEDQYFSWHPGINVPALASAAVANYRSGKVVRGGSTITMQIARMIEPKERTITNKLLEMFRSLQLEARYTKDELLEFYFNLAPYGGNIEGVGAACCFYFDKTPLELTWSEAALLTAVPNSPERLRPDRNPKQALSKRNRILSLLAERGVISDEEYESAIGESLPVTRQPVPTTAPHFCRMVADRNQNSSIIHTTVRHQLQTTCESLARTAQRKLKHQDVHNLALVVLDNRTGEIRTMVGSPDFFDKAHGGQINGTLALRSPGSTLKPFVYALAFENGLLSPEKVVPDVPVDYSGYQPENYDELYHGLIPVRKALVRSYNVPAVNAASGVGLRKFHRFLRVGGLSSLDPDCYKYGLPLVLGAAEVRLLELTNLYASLGRGGIWKPTVDLKHHAEHPPTRILSEGSVYLVSNILTDLKRPDLPTSWESAVNRPAVAWKTGTSYGRRDAWAVGYNSEFTVGVWVGNFSGEGSVDLVGAESAAPLMFDVFNELSSPQAPDWLEAPPGIGTRDVCVVSGQPVGRFCDKTIKEHFLIGKSPSSRCTVHRPILVDRGTGMRITAACAANVEFDRQVVEIWPPTVASWLVQQGLATPLPRLHANCSQIASAARPVIVSPPDGAMFHLIDHIPEEYQKISLEASLPDGDGTVHWFVDGELLVSSGAADRTFYLPKPGRHTLLCVDDQGRSAKSGFTVE